MRAHDPRALHRVGRRVEVGTMEQRIAAAVQHERVAVTVGEHGREAIARAEPFERDAADEQLHRRCGLDRVVGVLGVERLTIGRRHECADVCSVQRGRGEDLVEAGSQSKAGRERDG